MAHDVFISHSKQDKAVADIVCVTLERAGIVCWLAPRNVQPGADWGNSLIQGIRGSRVMVLVLSAAANSSQHIIREVERAVHLGIPVVPLRIEDVLPQGALEYHLGTVHWLDAMTSPLDGHLQRLVDTLLALLQKDPLQPKGVVAPPSPPMPFKPAAQPPAALEAPAVSSPQAAPSIISLPPMIAQAIPYSAEPSLAARTEPRLPQTVSGIPAQPVRRALPVTVLGGILVLILVALAYWWTHRSDPLDELRKVDWNKVRFNDSHFVDCKDYQPCLAKKTQSERLKNTAWNDEMYSSQLFVDCMEYEPCNARKNQAARLAAIKDWSRVDDKLLLGDCMGYPDCLKARLPIQPKKQFSQELFRCNDDNVERYTCCKKDFRDPAVVSACRACKQGQSVPDCVGLNER